MLGCLTKIVFNEEIDYLCFTKILNMYILYSLDMNKILLLIHLKKFLLSFCYILGCPLKIREGDFLGDSVVKTPSFQCWRHGFNPWSGN